MPEFRNGGEEEEEIGDVLGDVFLSGTQPFSRSNPFFKSIVPFQTRLKFYSEKPICLLSLPSQVTAPSCTSVYLAKPFSVTGCICGSLELKPVLVTLVFKHNTPPRCRDRRVGATGGEFFII